TRHDAVRGDFLGHGIVPRLTLAGSPGTGPQAPERSDRGPTGGSRNRQRQSPVRACWTVGASGSVYGPQSLAGSAGDSAPAAPLGPGVPYPTASPEQEVGSYQLVPGQEADADLGLYLDLSSTPNPQAIRGGNGGTDPGPRNEEIQRQNSDLFARPGTDNGNVANAKWPMGLSSARSGTGGGNPGWARQQNTDELPIAIDMAGVDMRLRPNAYREMHWHSANEWSYILSGSVRLSAVNQNGQTFVDDLRAGDLWFFPAGVPHSIQATEEGCEFLLVFSQGDFSEDDTDLVTELFLRNPKQVLAKNFQTDVSTFANIPQQQRYIFTGQKAGQTLQEARDSVAGPAGHIPDRESYSYHFSAQEPYVVPGGSVKIADPDTFPIANNFSAALFTIEPGAMREIHWHLTSDEWNFFLQGQGRVTVFTGPQASRTFDYQAGDVGYIPDASSHYVENTGPGPLVYLEVLQAPRYEDVSAAQWLGLTLPQVVKETLNLPQSFIDTLPKTKRYIVPGDTNLTATNFTVASYPNAALNATAGSSANDTAS
ncbi:oxalate decarboxylase, partial [Teratosphaeria destructans]